ncbi:5'-methylthioadenosine/adenosylhomocysteine nucleosidase [Prochlorococcus sp. AH-736-A21]|nr:5'-methylthioadenosine/adenosylhomocysteine nucleosidase [Prochlorococcus sp. AH-736-A21]
MSKIFHIGILGAMPEEIGEIINHLKDIKEIIFGDLKILSGELIQNSSQKKIFITTAWSGWGKVSASRATTRVLSQTFEGKSIDLLIFTGVAGSVNETLKQWDIVIAQTLIQHDMDASPLYPKYVIPPINKMNIDASKTLVNWSENLFKQEVKSNKLKAFGQIVKGKVATGDQFISDNKKLIKLKEEIPNLDAVEMEGAAVAQVAYQEKIPWLIIRVISDSADNDASQIFEEFLKKYEKESWNIISVLLNNLPDLEKFSLK